jgi:hypothetical protein
VQPWTALLIEHSSSVLGIYVSYANAYSAYEIIPVSLIDSPLALIPVRSQHIARDLWISVSFDHVRIIYSCFFYTVLTLGNKTGGNRARRI